MERAEALIEIDRYRAEDKPALASMYRQVLGESRADALLQRWEWQYERNPSLPDGAPLIWVARENGAIVGQYATMPVRLWVNGTEIDAAWGTDVMVAPEGQRKGLGHRLFETWDRNVGAAIGLGLTDASTGLFRKLGWPELGQVPRFVKPLHDERGRLAAVLGRMRGALGATRDRGIGEMEPVTRFGDEISRLWERSARHFAFAVRRDARYLDWKFAEAPTQYSIAVLRGDGEARGYVVYRHVAEADKRATILVDFLADPADDEALPTMLRWLEREARGARSEVIRAFTTFEGYHGAFRDAGWVSGALAFRFVAKINAVQVPPEFYSSERWHVTAGDSDVDR